MTKLGGKGNTHGSQGRGRGNPYPLSSRRQIREWSVRQAKGVKEQFLSQLAAQGEGI